MMISNWNPQNMFRSDFSKLMRKAFFLQCTESKPVQTTLARARVRACVRACVCVCVCVCDIQM